MRILAKKIKEQHGVDTSELEFRTVSDQREALIIDVQRVRKYKLLNMANKATEEELHNIRKWINNQPRYSQYWIQETGTSKSELS